MIGQDQQPKASYMNLGHINDLGHFASLQLCCCQQPYITILSLSCSRATSGHASHIGSMVAKSATSTLELEATQLARSFHGSSMFMFKSPDVTDGSCFFLMSEMGLSENRRPEFNDDHPSPH